MMNEKSRLKKALLHPEWLVGVLMRHTPIGRWMNDRTFIKYEFFSGMRKFPDLENPKTYNEKLQWLKLNDIHMEYGRLVDKFEAKQVVNQILGGDAYTIPTLGVWERFEEIDFDSLPEQFVLKTTHDSGSVIVVKSKREMDRRKVRAVIERSLKHSYFYEHREYPYKYVKPRILAEQYMVDESGKELKDYKFFCFDGEPKMLFIATDRPSDTRFDFFDTNFNHLPFRQGHPWATKEIKKPGGFDAMLEVARKLSKGYPHVRVDLYNIKGKIYFGELTFFHFSGNVPFEPAEWDYKIGTWLKLPGYDD